MTEQKDLIIGQLESIRDIVEGLGVEALGSLIEYATQVRAYKTANTEAVLLAKATAMYEEVNKFGGKIYTRDNVCKEFGITLSALNRAIKSSTNEDAS